MTVPLNDLPVIDWDANRKLAGHRADLGDDMIQLLAKILPKDLAAVNQFYDDKNYPELFAIVHKLHGAVAYCGTPRLLAVLSSLEVRLKATAYNQLPELILQLNEEASLFQKNCSYS